MTDTRLHEKGIGLFRGMLKSGSVAAALQIGKSHKKYSDSTTEVGEVDGDEC
jgi:hypothetical protein